ncbi:hypothetical protein BDD12DRAFT_519423 [Trichophaea hybrida]|nr:hypothetical protein BDD12DRAFT_519423 [Trichophaea hybrida]
MTPLSLEGAQCFISFRDDPSSWTELEPIRKKSDAFGVVKKFFARCGDVSVLFHTASTFICTVNSKLQLHPLQLHTFALYLHSFCTRCLPFCLSAFLKRPAGNVALHRGAGRTSL